MTLCRFALHAQQCAWPFSRKIEHLRRLSDGFQEFELTGVDSLQILMPSGARCGAAFGGRAKRFQVDIFDTRLFERGAKRRLGEAWSARQRQRPHVDDPLDPRILHERKA